MITAMKNIFVTVKAAAKGELTQKPVFDAKMAAALFESLKADGSLKNGQTGAIASAILRTAMGLGAEMTHAEGIAGRIGEAEDMIKRAEMRSASFVKNQEEVIRELRARIAIEEQAIADFKSRTAGTVSSQKNVVDTYREMLAFFEGNMADAANATA